MTAFETALAALVEAASTHDFSKASHADVASVLKTRERACAWIAFDMAGQDVAKAEGLAEQIAKARGAKEDQFKVYRQRARNAASRFHAAIAAVPADKRATRNPYSMAKSLAEKGAETAASAAGNAPHMAEAMSVAAGVLETSVPALMAQIMAGDGAAVTVLDAALADVKGRATFRAEFVAMMSRALGADDETRAFAVEVCSGFLETEMAKACAVQDAARAAQAA